MAYNKSNYVKRAEEIQHVTKLHYEEGRQDRCYRWVWANYIRDTFHIGYRAYLKALGVDVKSESEKLRVDDGPVLPGLFD